jgi:hypothetical protein
MSLALGPVLWPVPFSTLSRQELSQSVLRLVQFGVFPFVGDKFAGLGGWDGSRRCRRWFGSFVQPVLQSKSVKRPFHSNRAPVLVTNVLVLQHPVTEKGLKHPCPCFQERQHAYVELPIAVL